MRSTPILVLAIAMALVALASAGPAGAAGTGLGVASSSADPSPSPFGTSSPSAASPSPTVEPSAAASPPATADPSPAPTPTVSPTPTASAAPIAPVVASVAARPKVVVVVGPVGAKTSTYIARARALAAQARSYGAVVLEIYSPAATWARVKAAARGAKVLIYLGHGNGYPNPYGPFDPARADGLGLNAAAGAGNSNTRYYGESLVAAGIRLAPGALVILNHLCYASGDNEWGKGDPTRAVAMRRVDNYGAGFLRAGAAAVIADGLESPSYVLRAFFRSTRTVRQIFWAAPHATRTWTIAFASRRTTGASAVMDPYAPSRYYRSVVGRLDAAVSAWR